MGAGSYLGDGQGSLKPGVPVRRYAQMLRHVLPIRPIKSGEDLAVYIDVNPARRAFVVGIYSPPDKLYERRFFWHVDILVVLAYRVASYGYAVQRRGGDGGEVGEWGRKQTSRLTFREDIVAEPLQNGGSPSYQLGLFRVSYKVWYQSLVGLGFVSGKDERRFFPKRFLFITFLDSFWVGKCDA